jgi:hypothetical protein
MQQSGGFRYGVLALIAVALVSLIPYFGSFVIAPLVALAFGAVAGRRAAGLEGDRNTGGPAKAGALVGLGALIGSIIGLTLLVLFVVDIPAVQEYIRTSEPNLGARVPYEWMMPIGALMGIVVGFLAGLFDLVVAVLGGLIAGWVYHNNHPVTAA